MPPKRPENPGCNCRPAKPCFEDIQNIVASARKTQLFGAPSQNTASDIFPARDIHKGDQRDINPELDIVPTIDCTPPEQGTMPAEYPGAPCSEDNRNGDVGIDKTDTGNGTTIIERELKAQAAKSRCPCDVCVGGVMFEDCANPYIEIERKYVERIRQGLEVSAEFIPDDPTPHDCREHLDRPRDRAPGDPESDFVPKPCKDCVCCAAFRPHPPATLSTPSVYRTCKLPKRFKYPAWFNGYGNNSQHPMYRTASSEFGRYPPTIHTVPTVYYHIDRSWSNLSTKIGPYRDRGLRTTGSIWDAYTYYDFW